MRGQPVLVEQVQNIVDNRVLGFAEQIRPREGGLRNAGTGILAAKFGDAVVERSCFVQRPFRSSTSTIRAISQMLETVASSRDTESLVGTGRSFRNVSTKVACACAITPCRTQFSVKLQQHCLVQPVSTCLRLSRNEPPDRFPCCPRTT